MLKQKPSPALLSPGPSLFSNSTLSPLGQWVGKFIQSLQALFPPVPYTYPLLHPEWTLPFPCLYTFPPLSQRSCSFLLPRMLPVPLQIPNPTCREWNLSLALYSVRFPLLLFTCSVYPSGRKSNVLVIVVI